MEQNKEAFTLLVKLGANPKNPEYLGKLKQMPQYKFSFQRMSFDVPNIQDYQIYKILLDHKKEGKLDNYLESIGLSFYKDKNLLEVAKSIRSLLDWDSEDTFDLFKEVVSYPHDPDSMETFILELLNKKDLEGLRNVRKFLGKEANPGYNLLELLDDSNKEVGSESEIAEFMEEWMNELGIINRNYEDEL